MSSIKILLNNQSVFSPSAEQLKEKGFMVTVHSKKGIPPEKEIQEIILQMLNKEGADENNPELIEYNLKVGDKITIIGNLE